MIYLAAPLFTSAERRFNKDLSAVLESVLGTKIFLPQEECGDDDGPRGIFTACLEGIERSDAVIAILDGTDTDSGTSFEAGYAYSRGIPVIGVRTDFRMNGEDKGMNIMLSESCRGPIFLSSLVEDDILNKIAKRVREELGKTG